VQGSSRHPSCLTGPSEHLPSFTCTNSTTSSCASGRYHLLGPERNWNLLCGANLSPLPPQTMGNVCLLHVKLLLLVNLILRLHTAPYECQTDAQPRPAQVSVLMWAWYLSRVRCETILTKVNTIYGDFGSLTRWASSLLLCYPPMKKTLSYFRLLQALGLY
jgi:hypothetical protein